MRVVVHILYDDNASCLFPKVPSGKTGSYVCTNRELGVERGSSAFFKVPCEAAEDGTANVGKVGSFIDASPSKVFLLPVQLPPSDDHWPQCLPRTTTFSPGWLKTRSTTAFRIRSSIFLILVIPVAVDEMLANSKRTLERRMSIQQYEDGFEISLGEDWFVKAFIPSVVCKLL